MTFLVTSSPSLSLTQTSFWCEHALLRPVFYPIGPSGVPFYPKGCMENMDGRHCKLNKLDWMKNGRHSGFSAKMGYFSEIEAFFPPFPQNQECCEFALLIWYFQGRHPILRKVAGNVWFALAGKIYALLCQTACCTASSSKGSLITVRLPWVLRHALGSQLLVMLPARVPEYSWSSSWNSEGHSWNAKTHSRNDISQPGQRLACDSRFLRSRWKCRQTFAKASNRKVILHAQLQKLVGELFVNCWREMVREIWRKICRLFWNHKFERKELGMRYPWPLTGVTRALRVGNPQKLKRVEKSRRRVETESRTTFFNILNLFSDFFNLKVSTLDTGTFFQLFGGFGLDLGHSDLDLFTWTIVQNWISLCFLGKNGPNSEDRGIYTNPS